MWTKRQFISAAFEEIGLANYVFDLQPEQWASALMRLDAMMAAWNAQGIRIGYPIPSGPVDGNLDEETSVPDSANDAIITNLAVRIAPAYGKQVAPETKIAARETLRILQTKATIPIERQTPAGMPLGAGYKRRHDHFTPTPTDRLLTGDDAPFDFED